MEHTGLLFLFTCQPTKSTNLSRSGVNVRAHLLRKNYSRNLSSIRSAPLSSGISERLSRIETLEDFKDGYTLTNKSTLLKHGCPLLMTVKSILFESFRCR